jgi:hypothetical protein
VNITAPPAAFMEIGKSDFTKATLASGFARLPLTPS